MDPIQILNTCTAQWPIFVNLAPTPPQSAWIDISKTLFATFIGGLSAIATNILLQRHKRIQEEKTAGNLAIATLSRQYGDFTIVKLGVEKELKAAAEAKPQIPIWRALAPSLMELDSNLQINFTAIAFLIEKGDDQLFLTLVEAESKYHEIRRLLDQVTEAASDLHTRFEAANWKDRIIPSAEAAETAAGTSLIGKLTSLNMALKHRVETSGPFFLKGGQALELLMKKRFKNGIFKFQKVGVRADLAQLVDEE